MLVGYGFGGAWIRDKGVGKKSTELALMWGVFWACLALKKAPTNIIVEPVVEHDVVNGPGADGCQPPIAWPWVSCVPQGPLQVN